MTWTSVVALGVERSQQTILRDISRQVVLMDLVWQEGKRGIKDDTKVLCLSNWEEQR